MPSNKVFTGTVLVGLGAASYGMLATFVKLAYASTGITGKYFSPAEVISAQFIIGIISMVVLNILSKYRYPQNIRASRKEIMQLLLTGTSTGLTSIFYYLSVRYIPVSIAIVLLMQTVWMGVLLEMIIDKKIPSLKKSIALIFVLIGTCFATNAITDNSLPDWRGLILGLLAAASFTTTMYTANKIALQVSAAQRSLFMLLGGGVMVFIFCLLTLQLPFNIDILWKWGILLALFGTVLPPLLLNAGFPKTGIGLGSIISSLELPVSVCMAFIFLHEQVVPIQWIGIGCIVGAIILMNLPHKN